MEPSQSTPGVAQPSNGPALPNFQPQKPMSMDDLMKQTWKSTDLVRVKNIDDEEFSWNAANPHSDTVVQPDKVTYEVYRSAPEHYTLKAGETNIYYGYAAYLMVNGLYRRVLAKKGQSRTIGSPDVQKDYLEKIYLGTVNPLDLVRESTAPASSVVDDVSKDLGLNDQSTTPDKAAKAK